MKAKFVFLCLLFLNLPISVWAKLDCVINIRLHYHDALFDELPSIQNMFNDVSDILNENAGVTLSIQEIIPIKFNQKKYSENDITQEMIERLNGDQSFNVFVIKNIRVRGIVNKENNFLVLGYDLKSENEVRWPMCQEILNAMGARDLFDEDTPQSFMNEYSIKNNVNNLVLDDMNKKLLELAIIARPDCNGFFRLDTTLTPNGDDYLHYANQNVNRFEEPVAFHLEAADYYKNNHQFLKAIRELQSCLNLVKDQSKLNYASDDKAKLTTVVSNLCECLLLDNKPDQMAETIGVYSSYFENHEDQKYYYLGRAYNMKKQYQESSENFKKAFALNPDSALLPCWIGMNLYESILNAKQEFHQNTISEVIFYLEKAVELGIQEWPPYHILGELYKEKGDNEKGDYYCLKAVEMMNQSMNK